MTIGEVIAMVDEIQPNTYDELVKFTWLSELDGKIFNNVVLTHEHDLVDDGEGNMIEPTFTAYTDENEELIAPDEYADLYRHYLMAMIAYANGESERYTNSMVMFNSVYDDFAAWYMRNYKSIIHPLRLF